MVLANGLSLKASDDEVKLDEGDIQEAESSLREGLSLNYEVSVLYFVRKGWIFIGFSRSFEDFAFHGFVVVVDNVDFWSGFDGLR